MAVMVASGVQGELPAPAVHRDEVMERAEQQEVIEAGAAAFAAGPEVVDLAGGGALAAAGERAVPVPGDHRAAQVPGDLLGRLPGVQRQAGGAGRAGQQARAQERGQPGGAGQQVRGVAQDQAADPGAHR